MASTIVSRTQSGAESVAGRRTWTFSCWFKRSKISSSQELFGSDSNGARSNNYNIIDLNASNQIDFSGYESGTTFRKTTTRLFRDTNAWYHLVIAFDTTQSTADDRIKMYINGVRETSFGTSTNPSQDHQGKFFASNKIHAFGRSSQTFDGVISHVHATEGTAYAPTVFGSTDATTGEWKINTSPSVSYGTNGFFLFKDDNSVNNQAGNSSGNFTVSAGTLTKTEDNPSNVFATLNPLSTKSTLSHGNTEAEYGSSSNNYETTTTTLGMTSGKYYCECKITTDQNAPAFGISATNSNASSTLNSEWLGGSSDTYGYWVDGAVYNNGSTLASGQSTFSTNDIMGMALDLDSTQNTLKYYKNGSLVYTINVTTNSNGWLFATTHQSGKSGARSKFNFGNGYFRTDAVSSAGTNASGIGIFEYDVPSGYTALSTKGLNE